MATIKISHSASFREFSRVSHALGHLYLVERDDHTCVEHRDEIEGARLLAVVNNMMAEERGEVD
jgi:hypothetical protein